MMPSGIYTKNSTPRVIYHDAYENLMRALFKVTTMFISIKIHHESRRIDDRIVRRLPNKVFHVPHTLLVILSTYFLAVQRYKFRIQPRYGLKKQSVRKKKIQVARAR